METMSRSNNATPTAISGWEQKLAKFAGVSPEALLLAARDRAMSPSSSPSSPSSSSTTSSSPSAPPPLVLYDVTKVTDRQIVNGLYTSSTLGFLCVLGFVLLRPHIKFYEARRHIGGVLVRPPSLRHGAEPGLSFPSRLAARAASWLVPVFSISDAELVRSAGLDALMVHRTLSYGLLLFAPLAVAGSAVLLPLYATAGGTMTRHDSITRSLNSTTNSSNSSTTSSSNSNSSTFRVQKLAQLAMGNLPPGSRSQLVPFFFSIAALCYGCWLLDVFLKEFVLLRQMYLSSGEAAGALAAASAAVRSRAREKGRWRGSGGEGEGQGEGGEETATEATTTTEASEAAGAKTTAPTTTAQQGRTRAVAGPLTWEAIAAAVEPDGESFRNGADRGTAATAAAAASSSASASTLRHRRHHHHHHHHHQSPSSSSPSFHLSSRHLPVPLRKTLPIIVPGERGGRQHRSSSGSGSRLVAVGADLFAALAVDVPPPPPPPPMPSRKATAAAKATTQTVSFSPASSSSEVNAGGGRGGGGAGGRWRRGWMLAGFGGGGGGGGTGTIKGQNADDESSSSSSSDSDDDEIESAVSEEDDASSSFTSRCCCCCSRALDALGAVAALCAGPLTAPAASGFDGDGDLAIAAAPRLQQRHRGSKRGAEADAFFVVGGGGGEEEEEGEEGASVLLAPSSTSPEFAAAAAAASAAAAAAMSGSGVSTGVKRNVVDGNNNNNNNNDSSVAALGSAAAAARAAFSLRNRARRRRKKRQRDKNAATIEDGVAAVSDAPAPPAAETNATTTPTATPATPTPTATTTPATTATATTATATATAPALAPTRRSPLPAPSLPPEAWFAAASRLGGRDLVDAVFSRVAGARAWGGSGGGGGGSVVGGGVGGGGGTQEEEESKGDDFGFYLGSIPVRDHRRAHAALEALEAAREELAEAEEEAEELRRGSGDGDGGGGGGENDVDDENDDDEKRKKRLTAAADAAVAAASQRVREAELAVVQAQREALQDDWEGGEGEGEGQGEGTRQQEQNQNKNKNQNQQPTSFIALFSTPAAAAAVSSVPIFPQGWRRSFRVCRAPGADEVCWQALWTTPSERRRGRLLAALWLLFFVGLPVGIFAGALANLEHAACSGQRAATAAASVSSGSGGATAILAATGIRGLFCNRSSFARSLVTGTLPPVLVALWSCLVMPKALLRGVLLASSSESLSKVDARVCELFFVWTFFNVVVGAILGGSALLLIPSLLRDPASVYRAVGGSLSNASNFFVNYLETQALLMAPFRLLWPCSVPLKVLFGKVGRGLKRAWKKGVAFCSEVVVAVVCCCCRGRRRKKEKQKEKKAAASTTVVVSSNDDDEEAPPPPPPRPLPLGPEKEDQEAKRRRRLLLDREVPRVSLRAGREVGGIFFQVAAVALSYGAVAPLALPFAALWCALSWVVWRLQILYVFERSYEGGGALFFTAAAGIAAALGAHGFFTGCVLAANGAVALGGALAVGGPVGVWLFHRRCGRRYGGMAAAGAPALLTASVGSCVVVGDGGRGRGGGGGGGGGGGEGREAASTSTSWTTAPTTFLPPEPPAALRDIWTPPALRKGAKGWQQSEGAVWQGWKAPAFFPKA